MILQPLSIRYFISLALIGSYSSHDYPLFFGITVSNSLICKNHWQHNISEGHWDCPLLLSNRTSTKLQSMMKEISQLASLSCTYTNHCIRATTCTILDRAGHKTHEIMAVTGHKNESSVGLRSYINCLSIGQKRKLSESLSGMSAQLAGSATVSNTSTANSLLLKKMENSNAVLQQGVA